MSPVKRRKKKTSTSALSRFAEITTGVVLWGNLPIGKAETTANANDLFPQGSVSVSGYLLVGRSKSFKAPEISETVKLCYPKSRGISRGRTCEINNDIYHFKYASDKLNYRFQETYNLLLLKNVLEVDVPKFGYVLDSRMYFATLGIKGLVLASQHENDKDFRAGIVKHIGEAGVAKLAVAKTLIADLPKLENWGYVPEKGLVIIDADGGLDNEGKSIMPKTAADYLAMAAKSMRMKREKHPGELNLSLSRDNISDMKKIYENMLSKELPLVDASVDLNPELYKEVLRKYIASCEVMLNAQSPEVDPKLPLESNNLLFRKTLELLSVEMPFVEANLPNVPETLNPAEDLEPVRAIVSSEPVTSTNFFKPVIDAGKVLGDAATSVFSRQAEAVLAASATAIAKQISSASNASPGILPAPSSLTFLQKTPTEMNDFLIPMMAIGAAAGLAAAALVFCVWKKYHGKKDPSHSPRFVNTISRLKSEDVTIEIHPGRQSKSKR